MFTTSFHIAPRALAIALLLLAPGAQVLAQASSAHQALLLAVVEVNKIDVNSGFVSFALAGSTPNQTLLEGTSTDCSLIWTTNGYDKKITVARTATSDQIRLRIAVEEWGGTPVTPLGEIEFQQNGSYDFLRGISKVAGSCRLRLMATAEARERVSSDIHLLTYTITSD